jgi:hypothetical protein
MSFFGGATGTGPSASANNPVFAFPEFPQSLVPADDVAGDDAHFKFLATPNGLGLNPMLHVSSCASNPNANGIYILQSGGLIYRHQNDACACRIELPAAAAASSQGPVIFGHLIDGDARIPIRLHSHNAAAAAASVSPAPLDGQTAPAALSISATPSASLAASLHTFPAASSSSIFASSSSAAAPAAMPSTPSSPAVLFGQPFLQLPPFASPPSVGGAAAASASSTAVFGSPSLGSFGFSNPFSSLIGTFSTSASPSLPSAAPSAAPDQCFGSNASAAPAAGGSDTNDSHPPSDHAACALSADDTLVQAVPLALRVSFDDVLTSRTLVISIAGATGPDSGAINGFYCYIAGSEVVVQAEKTGVAVAAATTSTTTATSSKPTDASSFEVTSLSKDWTQFVPGPADAVIHRAASPPPKGKNSKGKKSQASSKDFSFSKTASILPLQKTTGGIVLEYHEPSRRLIVCPSASSGSGKGLLYCTLPFKLPVHNSIPMLLAACANEPWILESNGQAQPNVSISIPTRCANTLLRVTPQHFHDGLPVYTSTDPQPLCIRYNRAGAHWEMRGLHEERVLAVSAAHSIGFPAPMCWVELGDEGNRVVGEEGSEEDTASCIVVSGASVCDANGLYFTSKASGAHMLGGMCRIENTEIQGKSEWVLCHTNKGFLYSFKGPSSPFSKASSSKGQWVPVLHSDSPPVSTQLPLRSSSIALEQVESLRSRNSSDSRLHSHRISNVLTATWAPASDWKFFDNIPLSMTVTHIANTTLTDAALYQGDYDFFDVVGSLLLSNMSKPDISMFFRHALCGNVLHMRFSPDMSLASACIYAECETSSGPPNAATVSPAQASLASPFAFLSPADFSRFGLAQDQTSKLTKEGLISFNLSIKSSSLQPSQRVAAVLNVCTTKPSSVSRHRHVVNPHLVPMLSDLSHASFIKELLSSCDDTDAVLFWDKKLTSLCGSSTFADTLFVSNLLEFSKTLTSDKSVHASTAAVRQSPAFQEFIKLRLLSPMMASISAYLDFCFQCLSGSNQSSVKPFDNDWIKKEFTLTHFVNQDIATFLLSSICSKADFQCFLVAFVSEQYCATGQRRSQILLPAVASIISAIFNLQPESQTQIQLNCIKFRSYILGLHHEVGNLPLNLAELMPRTAPSLQDSLRALSSLIVATAANQSLLRSFLETELFQQLLFFSESIKQLSSVCPSSILLFKQAVADSTALQNLTFENIGWAAEEIKTSFTKLHHIVPCGYQVPQGWTSVKNKSKSRTYYFNTLSDALVLQLPRPSLNSLINDVFSMISFLTIELFETPFSQCSLKATHSTVANCFASNEAFASSVSEAFSRIQAYHYLHHVPTSASHPVRRELQLRLVDQNRACEASPGSIDISFDSSQIIRRRICSNCLMYCSSVLYQAKPDQAAPVSVPKDTDIDLLDSMFGAALAPLAHAPPQAPQNGHGSFVYPNNARYVGEFKGGKMHGNGVLVYDDGSIYAGEFKDGCLDGKGKLKQRDSSCTGQWKSDKRDGEGYFECFADKHNSNGTVIIAGETFKGLYRNDGRCGAGTTTFFNGETLSCTWTDGKSSDHAEFQRKVLNKCGGVVCISCILNKEANARSLGDIGPTIAAVFAQQRPLFQNCIKETLQRNFNCDIVSDQLGSQSRISFATNIR